MSKEDLIELLDRASEINIDLRLTINALKEDTDRLAVNFIHEYDGDMFCDYCDRPVNDYDDYHAPTCPITLHVNLMKSLEDKGCH
jgi:hypothetical protein